MIFTKNNIYLCFLKKIERNLKIIHCIWYNACDSGIWMTNKNGSVLNEYQIQNQYGLTRYEHFERWRNGTEMLTLFILKLTIGTKDMCLQDILRLVPINDESWTTDIMVIVVIEHTEGVNVFLTGNVRTSIWWQIRTCW